MIRGLVLAGLLAARLASAAGDSTRIEVTVDPRVELLTVVQCLAGDAELNTLDLAYRHDVEARFAPWRGHPAVTLYRRLNAAGFAHDAPPATVLRLSDPPDLELRAPFSAYLEERAGGRRALFAFLDSLRAFARDTRFMEFHAAHAALHRAMCEEARRALARTRVVGTLEAYVGTHAQAYHLALAPLVHVGGYGAQLERPPGRLECWAILGPAGEDRGQPVAWEAVSLEGLLWHEFAHTFVGRLPAGCRERIAADSALFGPLRFAMVAQGYDRWSVCVDEHLVRALGVRIVARVAGPEAGERALDQQRDLGFALLPMLVERLRDYEVRRPRYPTLADFCPELAAVFDEQAANWTRPIPPRDLAPR